MSGFVVGSILPFVFMRVIDIPPAAVIGDGHVFRLFHGEIACHVLGGTAYQFQCSGAFGGFIAGEGNGLGFVLGDIRDGPGGSVVGLDGQIAALQIVAAAHGRSFPDNVDGKIAVIGNVKIALDIDFVFRDAVAVNGNGTAIGQNVAGECDAAFFLFDGRAGVCRNGDSFLSCGFFCGRRGGQGACQGDDGILAGRGDGDGRFRFGRAGNLNIGAAGGQKAHLGAGRFEIAFDGKMAFDIRTDISFCRKRISDEVQFLLGGDFHAAPVFGRAFRGEGGTLGIDGDIPIRAEDGRAFVDGDGGGFCEFVSAVFRHDAAVDVLLIFRRGAVQRRRIIRFCLGVFVGIVTLDVAAFPCVREGEIARLQVSGTRCETFGNADVAGKISFTARIGAVRQLAGQRIQDIGDTRRICHVDATVVRDEGDKGTDRRISDCDVAARIIQSCFAVSVMRIIHIGVACIIANLHLGGRIGKNIAGGIFIGTAVKTCDMRDAIVNAVVINAGRRHGLHLQSIDHGGRAMMPDGFVLQPEIHFARKIDTAVVYDTDPRRVFRIEC